MSEEHAAMNAPHHDLPQDWPDHLGPDAEISAVRIIPPVGEPLLDFAAMDYKTFEQFCWWLLKKDETLTGCQCVGGSGTAQGGIDLLAFDARQPDRLNVFECKAHKDFKPHRLKEAVDEFLAHDWARSTNKFTLILAQKVAGPALLRQWVDEKRRLREMGIDAELWTAHELTLKVQVHPDILSKFFPLASIETHANIFMEQAGFYELASKALFDPRERVARWARELVGQSRDDHSARVRDPATHEHTDALIVDGVFRQVNQAGSTWHFKGPWFSLSAILPDQRFTHASAAITFNRPDMQGVTLTLDHQWLLSRFLFREGAPLTAQHRGFIVGPMPHQDDKYVVDFPHCRLTLEGDGVKEIAGVADLLTGAMRNSLNALETAWSAVDFPFVTWAGNKVAFAAIHKDVWQDIGLFAEEHDVSNGSTPWHMFDGSRHILKPYHETATDDFDACHHGVIHAAQIDGLSHADEVVLLWQPNGIAPRQALSPRGWWSCVFAFRWLNDALLPQVKRHIYERSAGGRWKQLLRPRHAEGVATYLDQVFVCRDLRQRPLIRDGNWSAGLVESVEVLQQFFNDARSPYPYIRQCEIDNLYRAAAIIARGKRGYVGYAASKLELHPAPKNHAELIDMIDDYIGKGQVVPCCAVADSAFRAMREMLNGSENWLPDADQATIRDHIAPFARLRDDAILVNRHTKWH